MTAPGEFSVTVQVYAEIAFKDGQPVDVTVDRFIDKDFFISASDGQRILDGFGCHDYQGTVIEDSCEDLAEAEELFGQADLEGLPWKIT